MVDIATPDCPVRKLRIELEAVVFCWCLGSGWRVYSTLFRKLTSTSPTAVQPPRLYCAKIENSALCGPEYFETIFFLR